MSTPPARFHALERVTLARFPQGVIPYECCDCPFGTASSLRDPGAHDEPNPYDLGEGDYDCALLGKTALWGEDPACRWEDWRLQVLRECQSLGLFLTNEGDKTE